MQVVYHLLARERAHTLLARALAAAHGARVELGRDVLGAVEIRVAAMPAQMAALAPPDLPAGAPAAAFRELHLVVMSLGSPLPQETADLEERLRHELAHLALDEAVGRSRPPPLAPRGLRRPRLRRGRGRARRGPLRGRAPRSAARPARRRGALPRGASGRHGLHRRRRGGGLRPLPRRASAAAALRRPHRPAPRGQALRGRADERLRRRSRSTSSAAFARRWRGATASSPCSASRRPLGGGGGGRHAPPAAARGAARAGRGRAARRLARRGAAPRARVRRRRRLPAEEDELAQAMPPDPEVPKVEHDGRWYTLH